jgi:hypothetical protein
VVLGDWVGSKPTSNLDSCVASQLRRQTVPVDS